MATVHLFHHRRWFGWYNSPGSYEIAKKYGQLSNSRFWDGLFPGVNRDPSHLFGLDGRKGPRFLAAHSGSVLQHSGHLAHLVARKADAMPAATRVPSSRRPHSDAAGSVTTIELNHAPPTTLHPPRRAGGPGLLALFPIAASVGACVLSGLAADWWCCASIALGVLASGLACFAIGSGQLTFAHPAPAAGAPPGDGVLLADDGIVVLRGAEGAVNALTRGRFGLRYGGGPRRARLGACSVLLTVQFLLQLLFIPQGTLFGQIMFVVTLAASWLYNTYLSALDKEDIQTEILLDVMRLSESDLQKYSFGTRTAMVVFTCLALESSRPKKILDELLPNDTPVWQHWKKAISFKLEAKQSLSFSESDWKLAQFGPEDQQLLRDLFVDATEAYLGFRKTRQSDSESVSEK
ncbi:hypothetical protein BD413DRAFT_607327 [Trametes elegans]|nr:hypothetical protein BD413DRAFT_607327 [Trametes elegans]